MAIAEEEHKTKFLAEGGFFRVFKLQVTSVSNWIFYRFILLRSIEKELK
jgi:hypothetical protein